MKPKTGCCLLMMLCCSSCIVHRSYYMSPLDINSNPYHTLPSVEGSQKAATYANLDLLLGSYNDDWRDGVFAARGSMHRGYRFGHFQAYYGGNISVGNYTVGAYDQFHESGYSGDRDTLHIPQSDQSFGAWGLNGGMNLVIPFANGKGEWRAIGFETGYQKEFGTYGRFRRQLPDSVINTLATYGHIFSLGGTTEIIGITRHGTEFGYKAALGTIFFSKPYYRGFETGSPPFYFSQSIHLTKQRVTAFMQLNVGVHAVSFQFGVNYNLSKKPRI